MAVLFLSKVVVLSTLLGCTFGQGFQDDTTIWVNGSNKLMYFSTTRGWLSGTTAPQPFLVDFRDSRKTMESVAVHYAWHYKVVSEQGTKTVAVFSAKLGHAVYAHVGTSPRVGHVTVDWMSNNVYWTDPGFGWIGLQGLKETLGAMATNARLKVVVSSALDSPYGVTVLPHIKRLFWSDHGVPPKVESSNLLGQERRTLVWQGLSRPTAVSADHTTTKLYWVDEAKGTVESCQQDGSNRRIVIFIDQSSLGGLQVFEEYILLSERNRNQLQVYNKDTGKTAANPVSDVYNPGDITVFSSGLQPRENVTCDTRSCDHICIDGESCVCSSGYTLSADGTSCTESRASLWKSFIISTTTKICAVPVNLLFSQEYLTSSAVDDMTLCFVNSDNVLHLAVDSHNATLYYVNGRTIHRFSIETGNDEELHSASSDISGLAYDWVGSRLVWSHPQPANSIHSLSRDDTQPVTAYSNLDNPAHLTVDSYRGFLFWINQGATAHQIWSGTVNGSQPKTAILTSDLTRPQNLVYDYKTDRLYWLDVDHVGSIERDGKNKQIFMFDSIPQYKGLSIFRGYLVWSTKGRATTETNMTFRGVDLTEDDDVVTFVLPAKIGNVTDLLFYDASKNIDTGANACDLDNGGCSQLCLVDGASRRCRCYFGFRLDQDGVTCTSDFVDSSFFVVTDDLRHQMYQVSEVSQQVSTGGAEQVSAAVLQDGAEPSLTTFNSASRKIIWVDSHAAAIKSSSFDGTSVRVIKSLRESDQPNTVGAIRIDQSTNYLFFTEIRADNSTGWIRVISLDTLVLRTLYKSESPPSYLAIAPQQGILVFGTKSGTLYKTDMAMEGTKQQLHTGISALSGLVFSQNGTSVEWSDNEEDGIWSMSLNTLTVQRRLETSGSHPHSLLAWATDLYYLTASGRTIKKLTASGAESTVVEFPEFGQLTSLHYFGVQEPEVRTACSERNGRCSTLCLPTPGFDRQCQCADGVQLLEDKRTCSNVERCSAEVRNGQLSASCDRYPAETCIYSCNDGYGANPDISNIKCSTSGHWNNATDRLCLVTCQEPLANGKADEDCHAVAGQTCRLICDDGYAVEEGLSQEMECGENGRWNVPSGAKCKATQTEPESLPVYAIGIISAGAVAVVAVVLGCVLYRRMKRYGGRDSNRMGPKAPEPTVLFVNGVRVEGAEGGTPPKQVEEEYDELENVQEEVRYHSFSKISPIPARRPPASFPGGLTNPGLILHDDTKQPKDVSLGNPAQSHGNGYGDENGACYIEPLPDYLVMPNNTGPATHHNGNISNPDYLTPHFLAKPASNGTSPNDDYLTPNLPPPRPHTFASAYSEPYSRTVARDDTPNYLAPQPPSRPEENLAPDMMRLRSGSRSDWTA